MAPQYIQWTIPSELYQTRRKNPLGHKRLKLEVTSSYQSSCYQYFAVMLPTVKFYRAMGVNILHENETNGSVHDAEAKSTTLDDTPNENSACADHIQEEMIRRVNEDVNTRDIAGEGDYTSTLGVTVNQTVTTTYSTAESDKDLDEKTEESQSLLKEIENISTVNDNDGENVHGRDLCDNDDTVEDKSKIPVDTGWAWAILFGRTTVKPV